MKGHIYLWQEISSYDKKYLPATRNFFVWQEINAFDKWFLPMTINFFLWKLITCSAKKFLPVTKNISCMLCVIRRISLFDRKYRPLSQICAKTTWNADKISCESEDFVGAWLPGSRLISHPALIYQVNQGYIWLIFSYIVFGQRVKWYFTDLKAIFRWIRILILYISNINISFRPPHPPNVHIWYLHAP